MSVEIISSRLFGPFMRFRSDQMKNRFGDYIYMIFDAEKLDDEGRPTWIRQYDSEEEVDAFIESVSE